MIVKNKKDLPVDDFEKEIIEQYNLSLLYNPIDDLTFLNKKDFKNNSSITIQEKNKFYNNIIEKIIQSFTYLGNILKNIENNWDNKKDNSYFEKNIRFLSKYKHKYSRDKDLKSIIYYILQDDDTNSKNLDKIYHHILSYTFDHNSLYAHPNCPDEILKDVITGMDIYDFYVMMKQPEKIKEDKDKKNIKNLKSRKNVMSIYETANDINTPTIQLRKILFTGSLFEAVLVLVNPNLDEKTFCEFYEYFGSEKEDIKEKLNKEFPHNNLKSWEIIYLSFGIRRENISIKMLDYLYNNYVVSMYEFLEKYKKERSFYLDFKYYEYSSKFILQNKITPFYILKDLSERASILNNDPFNDRRDPELYNILQDMIFQHPNYTIKNYLADFINN